MYNDQIITREECIYRFLVELFFYQKNEILDYFRNILEILRTKFIGFF